MANNIAIIEGTTPMITATVVKHGHPFDLSDASEIEITLVQGKTKIRKTRTSGEVKVSESNTCVAYVTLTQEDTFALEKGGGQIQIRVRMGSAVIGDCAQPVMIHPSLSQEVL